MNTSMKLAVAIAGAMAAAPAAGAHVVLSPETAASGSYYVGWFRVGHGCAGAATTRLRIEVPPDLVVVRPQPKPGWTLTIEHAPLTSPATIEGRSVSRRVSAITWSGGPLPDEEWDEFGVSMKLPSGPGPLVFTAVQGCGASEVRWSEVAQPGQDRHALSRPAPTLRLTPAQGGDPMAGMKMDGP